MKLKFAVSMLTVFTLIATLIGCNPSTNSKQEAASEPSPASSTVSTSVDKAEAVGQTEDEAEAGETAPSREQKVNDIRETQSRGQKPAIYQVLSLIREIEGFDGGAYDGIWQDENRYIYYTPKLPTENDTHSRDFRYYDYTTGDIYVNEDSEAIVLYNLFDSTTYPERDHAVSGGLSIEPEQLVRMAELEQKLYEQDDIYNTVWSPDYQAVAYCTRGELEDEVYVWRLGSSTDTKISPLADDTYYFEWSPDSNYLLLDSGTSAIRAGKFITSSQIN